MERETTRLEAFSDGVFAIAITLLVLELKVPHNDGDVDLLRALAGEWPSYFAFALSFATILVMWVSHHGLLAWVRRVDGSLLVLNGLVLLAVTVIPFPTAVLATYIGSRAGVLVYASSLLATLVAFSLLWAFVVRRRKVLAPDLPDAEVRLTNRYIAAGLAGYVLAIAATRFDPVAGLLIAFGVTALFLANAARRHRIPAPAEAAP